MRRRPRLGRLPLAGLALLLVAGQPGEVPLGDLLQIVVLEHEILALDARSGGDNREPLGLDERVLSKTSRGQVGVAITNRRMLAVTASSGAWQEAPFRQRENLSLEPLLGDRVALLLTNLRVLGFDGGSGNLVEKRFGPGEQVLAVAADANVAVAVTGRRALGVSPFVGGFFETPIHAAETLESVEVEANVAIVRTSRRLLIFRAPSGSWAERRLGLED